MVIGLLNQAQERRSNDHHQPKSMTVFFSFFCIQTRNIRRHDTYTNDTHVTGMTGFAWRLGLDVKEASEDGWRGLDGLVVSHTRASFCLYDHSGSCLV